VLGSLRAIAVNSEILRTLVRMLVAARGDRAKRLAELDDQTEALSIQHDPFSSNTRNQLKRCSTYCAR
jgi:Arc/MetJ-type ribon-helix-helix transcriptional regulator